MGSTRSRLAAVASVAALCAAIAGCSSIAPTMTHPKTASLASSSWGTCTEQAVLSTQAGWIRACVDYRYTHGRLRVLAVAASYSASSGYVSPYFTFAFRRPSGAVTDYKFSSPVLHEQLVDSDNTGLIDLAGLARSGQARHAVGDLGDVRTADVLQVSLWALASMSAVNTQMASVALTLNPRGLLCPALGTQIDAQAGSC
jgi:hypothetical protein